MQHVGVSYNYVPPFSYLETIATSLCASLPYMFRPVFSRVSCYCTFVHIFPGVDEPSPVYPLYVLMCPCPPLCCIILKYGFSGRVHGRCFVCNSRVCSVRIVDGQALVKCMWTCYLYDYYYTLTF